MVNRSVATFFRQIKSSWPKYWHLTDGNKQGNPLAIYQSTQRLISRVWGSYRDSQPVSRHWTKKFSYLRPCWLPARLIYTEFSVTEYLPALEWVLGCRKGSIFYYPTVYWLQENFEKNQPSLKYMFGRLYLHPALILWGPRPSGCNILWYVLRHDVNQV